MILDINNILKLKEGRWKRKEKNRKKWKRFNFKVPIGTQIFEEDNNTLIEDFTKTEQKIIIANGGKGGLGKCKI